MIFPKPRRPKLLVAEKLGILLAVLVLSLVISDLLAYKQIESLRGRLNLVINYLTQRQAAAFLIQQDLLKLHRAAKNVIMSDNREAIRQYKDSIDKYKNSIIMNLEKLEHGVSEKGARDIEEFRNIFKKWEKLERLEYLLKLKGNDKRAVVLSTGWSRILFDKLASRLDLIILRGNEYLACEAINAESNIQNTKMILFKIVTSIAIIFVLAIIYLVRSVTIPLLRLKKAAIQLAAGEFDKQIEIKTGDEIEVLSNSFNSMAKQLNERMQFIESQNIKLKELNALKTHFVSIVSHEFKSPLAIIRESQNVLLDGLAGEMTAKQKEVIEIEKKTIDRLIRLVRDLLDIARIESGKMLLKFESVEIAQLIQEVVNQFGPELQKKQIKLKITLDGIAGFAWVDRDKISQVVINLISNAVKYTPSGGEISISLEQYEQEIRFVIIDSGPGVKDGDLGKIFDRFERVTAEKEEGTGLGLPIAKEIVLLHKGSIWVESSPGHGSTFIFTIPQDCRSIEQEGNSNSKQ